MEKPKRTLTIYLGDELRERVQEKARAAGCSLSDLVRSVLENEFSGTLQERKEYRISMAEIAVQTRDMVFHLFIDQKGWSAAQGENFLLASASQVTGKGASRQR